MKMAGTEADRQCSSGILRRKFVDLGCPDSSLPYNELVPINELNRTLTKCQWEPSQGSSGPPFNSTEEEQTPSRKEVTCPRSCSQW